MLIFVASCWYLLLFSTYVDIYSPLCWLIFVITYLFYVDICWDVLILLLFDDICWSLSMVVDLRWSLLIFVGLRWSLLIFVDIWWRFNDAGRVGPICLFNGVQCCFCTFVDIFFDSCYYLLPFVAICWYLLLFVDIISYLLIFACICWYVLLFVDICCYLYGKNISFYCSVYVPHILILFSSITIMLV